MILHINNSDYDYHTLVKVAEMAENTQALIKDYKARLRDLENNIWQH